MDKKKQKKIMEQIRLERAARRQATIDLGLPQETSKVFKSTKKDQAEKESNKIRPQDIEE